VPAGPRRRSPGGRSEEQLTGEDQATADGHHLGAENVDQPAHGAAEGTAGVLEEAARQRVAGLGGGLHVAGVEAVAGGRQPRRLTGGEGGAGAQGDRGA
jgi:hypothetical protein